MADLTEAAMRVNGFPAAAAASCKRPSPQQGGAGGNVDWLRLMPDPKICRPQSPQTASASQGDNTEHVHDAIPRLYLLG